MSPDEAPPGNGLLLCLPRRRFQHGTEEGRALVTRLEEEPRVNPNTQTKEFSLRIRTDTTSQLVRSLRTGPREDGLTSAWNRRRRVAESTSHRRDVRAFATGTPNR